MVQSKLFSEHDVQMPRLSRQQLGEASEHPESLKAMEKCLRGHLQGGRAAFWALPPLHWADVTF